MKTPLAAMANVNLKLLHTFMLVGEHGSFREAAERAHRSQSAVSTQIRQLEEQLGVALFHRTTRRVSLTVEGAQLLECARRAVQEMELGLRKIQESADIQRGRIALACSPTIAGTRLAQVLAAFERDYPGVQVFVRELSSEAMFECVRQREVDFAFGPVVETGEFHFETILEDPLYALVPKRFAGSATKAIALPTLARMPLLLLDKASALRRLFEGALRSHDLDFSSRYQFTQVQSLISMARAGLGAAILPRVALPEGEDDAALPLRIVNPPLVRELAVITLRGQALSPAAARMVQLLRQLMGDRR